ncbi:glycosyltransferase [Sporichthya polymorpha]|uniref:glycosyltransferase n=1 Tax=Sporichthya polymorpha TaxID=35751 RepID=UPI00035FD8FC|nr:glycosyltransferase family 2 protein [Sporichthya polymorpha]
MRSPGRAAVAAGALLSLGGAALAAANVATVRVARPDAPDVPPGRRVSVLLPVRNEAAVVGRCLRALLAQEGVADLEILVLDDGSADGTADLARAVAGDDPRVRVLTGDPPPPGWLGKPHAGARLAAEATGDVLVFVDADVLLHPRAVAAAVAVMAESGLRLLSLMPRQVADSPGERLVQPLLAWSWLSTLPVRPAEHSRRPSTAAAIGQFLVVDRATYAAFGGHGAVRDRVVDDIELARAAKRAGHRAGMVVGSDVASCRMYADWAELRAGHTKWLWAAFGAGGRVVPAAAVCGVLLLLGPVPTAAALRGSRLGLAGYAAGVAGRALVARRVGSRVWPDVLAHPASTAAAAFLLADSVRARRRGTLTWKGRPLP